MKLNPTKGHLGINTVHSASWLLIFLISLMGCTSACSIGRVDTSYWFLIPGNEFRTNNLTKAQKEIPFTIILPSYLPEGIASIPDSIVGPLKAKQTAKISVYIFYQTGDALKTNRTIDIQETNTSYNKNSPSDYYFIGDIKVYEDIGTTAFGSGKTAIEDVPSCTFFWNMNGIDFDVNITNYDESEAKKVVASMFEE